MNALNRVKTRTQHFASSPRKTATPAKRTTRRSSKRQRLGVSSAFKPLPSNEASEEVTDDDSGANDSDSGGDSSAGDATFIAPTPKATVRDRRSLPTRKKPAGDVFMDDRPVARLRTRGRRSLGTRERVRTRQSGKTRAGALANGLEERTVASPRKRKRRGSGDDADMDTGSEANWTEMGDDADDEDDVGVSADNAEGAADAHEEGDAVGDAEVDMAEGEPELISTDDLFYLEQAAEWQLNKLRKAELVRLWKVVGMWDEEDENEEAEASMMKPELVDGLLKRREASLSPKVATPEADDADDADDLELDRGGSAEAPIVVSDDEEEDEPIPISDDEEDEEVDIDFAEATLTSLTRLLRDQLVKLCEARGLEVGGTKPQLAKSLLDWYEEQNASDLESVSSQRTARPDSSLSPAPPATWRPVRRSKRVKNSSDEKKIIHAVATPRHAPGQPIPVLLRDHIHATDPATPPHSPHHQTQSSSRRTSGTGEAELNLDLSELGLEDAEIKGNQLQKLEKIGSGGFKEVYVGKWRNRKVAISEFRDPLSEMDIRELKLLAEFSHKNIVKFKGICIPEPDSDVHCMLVSELCENGDLFDYIRNVPRPTLKRVLGIMLDMARGLEYLHTRTPAIIHRDVKSSNILINRTGVAKVGDFGLARVKHSTRSMIRSLVGTVNWQAPELWHPEPRYDYKVDVFSAGVVYWEMLAGWVGEKKYPWEGHNEHYIYDAVGKKHNRPSVAGLVEEWGEEPVRLIERMWHQDPRERPTMTDVVADLEVLLAEAGKK